MDHLRNFKISIINSDCSNLSFSLESIKNAIITLYSSGDDNLRNQAQEYLILWKNDLQYSFTLSIQFLQMDDLPPQVLFLSSVVLQNYIRKSWDLIDDQKARFVISLLIKIINENSSNANQSPILRLLLILCDIILLNFNYIEFVSQLNPYLLPKFYSNLYEIFNNKDSFLINWQSPQIIKNNLENQLPIALQLLHQFDTDPDWFDLHYQLLRFTQDFSYFYPFLEKLQNTASKLSNPEYLLKLTQLILSYDMEDSILDDQMYFKSIIEIVVSVSNALIFNQSNLNDESIYIYVIYLWDSIFDITDFFCEDDKFDFLNAIVNQYLTSLPQLIRHSSTFTDSLNHFSEFLNSNRDSEKLTPFVVTFLNFLSGLINTKDLFFIDDEIVNCIKCIQQGFEETVAKYVTSIMTKQSQVNLEAPESFFFILASTEAGFCCHFSEAASIRLIQILESSEIFNEHSNLNEIEKLNSSDVLPITAETTLLFIRKVGIFVDKEEIFEKLIFIVLKLFTKDADGAAKTIQEFAGEKPESLSLYAHQIIVIASSGLIQMNESSSLVVSLYTLSSALAEGSDIYKEVFEFIQTYIIQYLNHILSLFESPENETLKSMNSMNDFLYFLVKMLSQTPKNVSLEFKSWLYNFTSCSLKPFLLTDDRNTQELFCQLFELFFELSFITTVEQETVVFEWLEKVIPIQKDSLHLTLVHFIINDFQIPSILHFVISVINDGMNEDFNQILPSLIECIIHPLFLKQRSFFWEIFQPQFLTSLLTINTNIVALNNSLKLFIDIFNTNNLNGSIGVTADFAVLTLQTLCQSMISFYYKSQSLAALKIIGLIITNKIMAADAVISIFLNFFDIQIPEINELVLIFSGQKSGDISDSIEGIIDEVQEAIFTIRNVRNSIK